jgi:hypothetical protein
MICLRTTFRIYREKSSPKNSKTLKHLWLLQATHRTQKMCSPDIIVSQKIGIL